MNPANERQVWADAAREEAASAPEAGCGVTGAGSTGDERVSDGLSLTLTIAPREGDSSGRDELENDAPLRPGPDAANGLLLNFRHADPTAGFEVRTDEQISRTLSDFLDGQSYRQIAKRTGFHSESVRRYMQGKGRIPAGFIAAVSKAYGIDPVPLLLDCDRPPAFRQIPSSAPADWFTESVMRSLWPHLSEWFQDNFAEHAGGSRRSPDERSP